MNFCPKCQSVMVLREVRENKEKKLVYKCPKCGYESKNERQKIVSENDAPQESIVVLGTKETAPVSTIDAVCPKCDNRKAVWWMIQTRSQDEPSTRFYKCTNPDCQAVWREYD